MKTRGNNRGYSATFGSVKASSRSQAFGGNGFALAMLAIALLGIMTLSGCVGLTSASSPNANDTKTQDAVTGSLAANATSFAFGNVTSGSSGTKSLVLSNTGTATVTISGATVTGTGFSLQGTMTSVTIDAGQQQTFTLKFAPQTTGTFSGSMSITSDADNSPMAISLTGTGVSAPSITAQPANQTVTAGQTATFSVTADGSAPLSYQWQKNGNPISGATSASYTTTATVVSDNGASFAVVVTNSVSSVTSNGAILTVNAPPSITTQPANQTVTSGQTATFSVAATGTGTLTYQWKKNGTAIGGATSTSYTTPATASSDSGSSFTVVVTNSFGNATSNGATLTVTAAPVAPSITTQPVNQTVTAGQTATFTVSVGGTTPLTYQWKKNGTAISGATSASYTTPATAASDNGASFTVTVTNSVNNITSNAATLTVNVPPSISAQPASQTVMVGQTAAFSVTASGTGTLTYQWKKNGTAISGATSASYTTPATVSSDNSSSFTVVVTDNAGNMTSNAAMLTVDGPPSITTQPANQTVTAGQTATFSVAASGTGTLTYQWKKNGTTISGATSASYTTPATTSGDNGASFTAVVTNGFGNATSNGATLTVNVPPSITTQPASQTVTVGQTATFSVAASGSGTLTYQWKKNGTAISGATSASYTTPATASSDNGASFTVVVTGSTGNVTSNAAALTVNAPPSITTQPANHTVIAGQTATFSVAATGTGTLTYQWKKNGTAISGATSSSYTTPATTSGDNGAAFTVVVTNSAGNATSNAATLTVSAATLILNSSATTLNFNSVAVGNSASQNVTLTNAGNSNVTISTTTGVSISGAGFSASGVSNGQIIAPGKTATLQVTFNPSTSGPLSGSVTVNSNATNSPVNVTLNGTGAVAHSATITWNASTSTGVTGYNVYRSTTSGGSYTLVNTSLVTTLDYVDSNVTAGTTYYYVVTSMNSSDVESSDSTQVSATIPTP